MPKHFDPPSLPAVEIWNSLNPELQLVILGGIKETFSHHGPGVAHCAVKDNHFFVKTNDSMDYELFILATGMMGMWFNPKLSPEKIKALESQFGKLGLKDMRVPEAQEQQELFKQNGVTMINGFGLAQAKSGGVFHLPMCYFDCFKGVSWASLVKQNQKLLQALYDAPEGVNISALLSKNKHNLQLGSDLEFWS